MLGEPKPEKEMNLDLLNVSSVPKLQVRCILSYSLWLPASPSVGLLWPSDTLHNAAVKEIVVLWERSWPFIRGGTNPGIDLAPTSLFPSTTASFSFNLCLA